MFAELLGFLLTLGIVQVLTLMLILFALFVAIRCGWGVGAWLAGRLR